LEHLCGIYFFAVGALFLFVSLVEFYLPFAANAAFLLDAIAFARDRLWRVVEFEKRIFADRAL
jgi:hypothetical protein